MSVAVIHLRAAMAGELHSGFLRYAFGMEGRVEAVAQGVEGKAAGGAALAFSLAQRAAFDLRLLHDLLELHGKAALARA